MRWNQTEEPSTAYVVKTGQRRRLAGQVSRLADLLKTEVDLYAKHAPESRALATLTSDRRSPDLVMMNFKSAVVYNEFQRNDLMVAKPPTLDQATAEWLSQVHPWLAVWTFPGDAKSPAEEALPEALQAVSLSGRFFVVRLPRILGGRRYFPNMHLLAGLPNFTKVPVGFCTMISNSTAVSKELRSLGASFSEKQFATALAQGLITELREQGDNRFLSVSQELCPSSCWIESNSHEHSSSWIEPHGHVSSVLFLSPSQDLGEWREALEEGRRYLGNRSGAQWVTSGSRLHAMISALTPWEILRVQVAKVPKRKRLPFELGAVHH